MSAVRLSDLGSDPDSVLRVVRFFDDLPDDADEILRTVADTKLGFRLIGHGKGEEARTGEKANLEKTAGFREEGAMALGSHGFQWNSVDLNMRFLATTGHECQRNTNRLHFHDNKGNHSCNRRRLVLRVGSPRAISRKARRIFGKKHAGPSPLRDH